ncbi:uncharacterized protein K489DRAFT_374519 [Dissoconium aciculare CBS 342.82]|uniref:Uncharacterized protein n=1 Tax=Dissoconium aciculare CBS 342.82 TaxID=1314786 RepID=A0A6J3LSB7_9PEZI|nr:uncharacterized protein K489DRAFT_374519 [Dissoconium aciculare CBS 342.82]KAF1818184.1 hypothetical protein K489DRAFT_374519 [Dissoconium aciculare CBS 342.82]
MSPHNLYGHFATTVTLFNHQSITIPIFPEFSEAANPTFTTHQSVCPTCVPVTVKPGATDATVVLATTLDSYATTLLAQGDSWQHWKLNVSPTPTTIFNTHTAPLSNQPQRAATTSAVLLICVDTCAPTTALVAAPTILTTTVPTIKPQATTNLMGDYILHGIGAGWGRSEDTS